MKEDDSGGLQALGRAQPVAATGAHRHLMGSGLVSLLVACLLPLWLSARPLASGSVSGAGGPGSLLLRIQVSASWARAALAPLAWLLLVYRKVVSRLLRSSGALLLRRVSWPGLGGLPHHLGSLQKPGWGSLIVCSAGLQHLPAFHSPPVAFHKTTASSWGLLAATPNRLSLAAALRLAGS